MRSPGASTSGTQGRGRIGFNSSSLFLFLALLTLSVCLIELFDLFELPFESQVSGLLTSGSVISSSVVTSIAALGYLGIFVLMVLESASLPIPSEIVLPFAGYLVYVGSLDFTLVVIVATVAGLVGALADYYVAFLVGRPILDRGLAQIGVSARRLQQAEGWLGREGAWTILLARFVPGLRSVISFPAGALKMKLRPFVLMTLAGAFGWSLILIYLGYAAGGLAEGAISSAGPLATAIALVLAAGSLAYVVYFFVRRPGRSFSEGELGSPPTPGT